MPKTVIYANVLPFIGMIFTMLFMRINPLFDRKQNKLFFLSAITILFMLIVISIDYSVSISEMEYGWIIRRITSFFQFSFSCTVPIFLIYIFSKKKMNKLLYLPAFANLAVCAASIFFNLVFFFSESDGYDRGPLFFIPSVVTGFYIVVLLFLSFKERHTRAFEAVFIFCVILGITFAMYLEIVKRFKFLTWDFAASFLMLYYLLLNINKSKIDPLTGANNRSMYVQKTQSVNRSRRCIIAMIDINGFKSINDEKGHEEGDKLLIQFVSTANLFMDKKNVLYRIGGDEFAVISDEVTMENFEKRMETFFSELKKYDINCAVGFQEYDPEIDIESAIRSADMKMYENKRNYYADKAKA